MKAVKQAFERLLTLFFTIVFPLEKQKKLPKELEKTISLYGKDGFSGLFAKIRAWDAPYRELERLVPKKGIIVDLGSGDGLLSNYLALSSNKRKLVGVEINKDRVKEADRGVGNASFKKGDVLRFDTSRADVVILAHVLHHLPSRADQQKLLEKVASRMKKGGKLLILEIDDKPLHKYLFSWITDAIIVPILFEGRLFTTQFYYRFSDEWRKVVKDLGYRVRIRRIHKGMPFSHILIDATKE